MKKIKKRLVCLLLCVCMCSSLFMLYANAIEPLDGPINADDNATLIRPTLEVSDVPQGAVAVGYNIESGKITYYRVNGGTLPNNYVEDITIDGYFPNNTALADGGISTDQYIGTDDRQVVTDTTQSPNSAIAYLIANGSNSGTAYMLSKNVAITAAHCVFKQSKTNGEAYQWPSIVTVWPGRNGNTIPYSSTKVVEIVVAATYFTEQTVVNQDGSTTVTDLSSYYDWALLLLEDDVGLETGYFSYRYTNGSTGKAVSITGYKANGGARQYTHSGTTIRSDIVGAEDLDQTYIMHYTIDAGPGQSGAPIYYQSTDGNWVSIGLHTTDYCYDNGSGQLNQGNRFTSQLFSFVLAYTSKH